MFTERNMTSCTYSSPFSKTMLNESSLKKSTNVIFIGNPLSSACWMHRSIIREIQRYCSDKTICFSILMGYEKHDTLMASFLQNNTEPACRAIATARIMLLQNDPNDHTLLQFFTSIQEKFFEKGEDATQIEFYRSICEKHHLSYDAFVDIFNIIDTVVECKTTKKLGTSSFPALILDQFGIIYPLSTESLSFEKITMEIDSFL